MGTKINIRSFRYSDEVAGILEGFKGGSLNEKFENLILHCFWERKKIDALLTQRRTEHDRLCEQIQEKRVQLLDLDSILADKNRISKAITKLAWEVAEYNDKLKENVTQAPAPAPGLPPAECVTAVNF